MSTKRFMDAMGHIDDELISGAIEYKTAKKMHTWMRWAAAAACLAVVAGCFAWFSHVIENGVFRSANHAATGSESVQNDAAGSESAQNDAAGSGSANDDAADNESPSDAAAGSGHSEGSTFMSYAGPVFPLTVRGESSGLEVSRNINFDFARYGGGQSEAEDDGGNGSVIHDAYRITNTTETDKTVTAVYPVVGTFQSSKWPDITVNGGEVVWELYAGGYADGSRGAADEDSDGPDLMDITSWEGYRDLLSDGSYFTEAFAEAETLTTPVTVYELTDITSGGNEDEAATLRMSFNCDRNATQIMSYGFNGMEVGETGEVGFDFFIREGLRGETEEKKYLIVAGDDLEGYTLQGYQDGGCTPGTEITGATATVTRREATMGEVLKEIAQTWYDTAIKSGPDNGYCFDERISFEMFYQALVRYYAAFGPLGAEYEGDGWGMLDDIVQETLYQNRIFYLAFEITVPGKGTVSLDIGQFKAASFDYYCSGSENVGVDGYDMVTSLRSNLRFTEQTASISNYDTIEVVRQNFGFDLSKGIDTAVMDLDEPHYYLEIRKTETD